MTRLITHGHGYLLNDNRASGGALREYDVLCCPHCQAVINAQSWKAGDGGAGWCMKCAAPICGPCANRMLTEGCKPFMAQIDKLLADDYRRSQFRKLAGLDPAPPAEFRRIGVGMKEP